MCCKVGKYAINYINWKVNPFVTVVFLIFANLCHGFFVLFPIQLLRKDILQTILTMKIIKRLFLIFGIFIVLLLGLAAAVPIFFKDSLVQVVKEQINASINATADFAEVDISLFRSFPHLNLNLTDLTVVGKGQFADVPFLGAEQTAITIDIRSFFGGNKPLEVRSVDFQRPVLNVLVLADGSANYDITIPADSVAVADTTASQLEVALRSYTITDGQVTYDDRSMDLLVNLEGLNHQGEGNFTLSEYDLNTQTTVTALSVDMGGITYLKQAKATLAAIFHIDADNSIYTLKDNQLTVNELMANAEGTVQLKDEDIILDLKFNSPDSDFRSLWSLIPNAYTADYQNVDIAGTFRLEGLVKGNYNETTYPAFRILTKVENGRVKYPDLPVGINDIQALVDVNSPSSDLDKMLIDVSRLGIKVGSDPFQARIKVSTPISDPNVDANVDGIIDLAQWAKAFPLEGVSEMTGRITADVAVQTQLSTIEREAYEQVKMSGDLTVDKLRYAADGLPLVVIDRAVAQFTPQKVDISQFTARLGKSDLQASGSIANILAYISPEKTMRGNFKAHSNYFLVDEWMTTEETAATPVPLGTPPTTEEAIFDRFDLALDATANKIVYDTYTLTDAAVKGRVRPNLIEVESIRANLGESDFSGSGKITNVFDYLFSDGILGGNLVMNSNFFDLNPLMEETTPTTTASGTPAAESYGVIPIPANIDMTIQAKVNRLRYTDLELNDLQGLLTIRDEAVVVENGSAQALGGSMGFTGAYDTENVDKPSYNFKFDLKELDFQESFSKFNTFASFAPVGKLIAGKFSTSLLMSGELGKDMLPLLEAVNAKGMFETSKGTIKGLQPLAAVGNALNINELKENVNFDNLKSYFTIENGVFEVKPFDIKVAGYSMTVGGKHSLTQEMAYTINTVIPRSKLGTGALGNTVNQGISALVKQASQLGLNVNDAENLNVQISLTGNMASPKTGFKLLGTDGQTTVAAGVKAEATAAVQGQVDAAKDKITTEISAAKDRLTEQAARTVDSLKNIAAQQAAQAGQRALDQARGQAGAVLDSTKTNEALRTQAAEAADKLKGEIKDFNPFGKKKKSGGGGR